MNPYVQKLKEYLYGLPVYSPYDDVQSILELLCYIYTVDNPVSSSSIRYQFLKMDDILKRLSLEDNNMLFTQVCDLCDEHAKRGFMAGLRVGNALFKELSEQ